MIRPWWGTNNPPRLDYEKKILTTAAGLESEILSAKTPLDRAVQAYVTGKAGKLGSNDRAILTLAAFSLARNRQTIARAALGASAGEGALLRVALYDGIVGGTAHAPPDISPHLDKLDEVRGNALSILETVWESPCRNLDRETAEAFETFFSLPPFWLRLGPWPTLGEAARELNYGKFPQNPQLRVDALALSREALLTALTDRGIKASPTPRSPWGVVLDGRVGAGALKGLPHEMQDEGSQLAVLSCLPLEDGAKALDLCAGAGGKALLLAQVSGAKILLYDTDKARLTQAAKRITSSAREKIGFTDNPETDGPFDLVILDAPCSSTGTVRRNPDISWRYGEKRVKDFAGTQASIMKRAAALTKPGGLLLYVTCSLLDPENSGNIVKFLEDNPGFTPEPVAGPAFQGIEGAKTGVFRLPLNLGSYNGDGFFIARLRKK